MTGWQSVLKRHMLVFHRTWWANLVFNFCEPLLYLGAFGLGLGILIGDIDGRPYVRFIAPGMVASAAMWAATFECTYATFLRLNYEKAFEAMLAAPLSVADIVAGEIVFGMFKSVLFGTTILAVIAAWGLVDSWRALFIPLVLVLPGGVFACLALVYTSIIPHIDYLNYYITLIITPLYLLAGIFFPVSALPGWAQAANWLNPLFHTVEVCRALVEGKLSADFFWHLGCLAIMLLVAAMPLNRLFRRRLVF